MQFATAHFNIIIPLRSTGMRYAPPPPHSFWFNHRSTKLRNSSWSNVLPSPCPTTKSNHVVCLAREFGVQEIPGLTSSGTSPVLRFLVVQSDFHSLQIHSRTVTWDSSQKLPLTPLSNHHTLPLTPWLNNTKNKRTCPRRNKKSKKRRKERKEESRITSRKRSRRSKLIQSEWQ